MTWSLGGAPGRLSFLSSFHLVRHVGLDGLRATRYQLERGRTAASIPALFAVTCSFGCPELSCHHCRLKRHILRRSASWPFLLLTTHVCEQVTHCESNFAADATKSHSICVGCSELLRVTQLITRPCRLQHGTFGDPASMFGTLPVTNLPGAMLSDPSPAHLPASYRLPRCLDAYCCVR